MTTLEQDSLADLDLQSFAKAWVAGLIELGVSGVHPHETSDRRGFDGVVSTLDQLVEKFLQSGVQKSSILPLLRIVNELRPSSAGDYEGFELALRSLQLTFTASPNPWYDYITFPISKSHAESFLDRLPETVRDITHRAAKAYVEQRGSAAYVSGEAS